MSRTVFKALSQVQADLARKGIAKTDENTFDKYKFRGIDAVLNTLAPILADHGLVLVPSVDESEIRTIQSAGGKAMNHAKVKMTFTFYDEHGDSISHTYHGEAMDRGDKSINKACTAAYKYFLFQAFTIPVEGTPDADSESHEVGEADSRKLAHDAALARNLDSVNAIKAALAEGEIGYAYEAWQEVTDEDKQALWLAPSRGGCFTTQERAVFKSDEWSEARKAYHGQEEAA
jgi:hypothetical protein